MSEWKKVKIGDVFILEKGSLQSSKCIQGKYPFITAAEYWKTNNTYTHDCEAIVYAVAASGSLGRTHYVNGKFIASDLCFILTEKNKTKYPINFLFYKILFELLRDEIVFKTKTGTSKESISQKNLSNYEIPYFSIDFQNTNSKILINTKKIIANLSKEIESQKAYTKCLCQNILQEAIEGKLTENWRLEHPLQKGNPDYDAQALFALIQKEKKSDKKKQVLLPIKETEKPFEIPNSWKWIRLGALIRYTENLDIQKKIPPNEIINYIDIDSIDNKAFKIISAKQKTIYELSSRARRILKRGYIIYSTVRPYLCNIAIVDEEKTNYIGSTGFNVFKPILVNVHYLFYFLLTPYVINLYKELMQGFNSPSINNKQFENTLLSLPPLSEQKEIVKIVDASLSKITELEKEISIREEYINKLEKSILKNAFKE